VPGVPVPLVLACDEVPAGRRTTRESELGGCPGPVPEHFGLISTTTLRSPSVVEHDLRGQLDCRNIEQRVRTSRLNRIGLDWKREDGYGHPIHPLRRLGRLLRIAALNRSKNDDRDRPVPIEHGIGSGAGKNRRMMVPPRDIALTASGSAFVHLHSPDTLILIPLYTPASR